jgi:hypothetical protein
LAGLQKSNSVRLITTGEIEKEESMTLTRSTLSVNRFRAIAVGASPKIQFAGTTITTFNGVRHNAERRMTTATWTQASITTMEIAISIRTHHPESVVLRSEFD